MVLAVGMLFSELFLLCWLPLVGALISSCLVWLASWSAYAFGELVEDVHAIRVKCCPMEEEQANREKKEKKRGAKKDARKKTPTFFCPKCSKVVNCGDAVCSSCGQKFDWSKA